VIQDFQTANLKLLNSNNFLAGRVWLDHASQSGCAIGTTVGAVLSNVGDILFQQLNLNGMQTGVTIQNQAGPATVLFQDVFLNAIGQDGIQLGGAGGSNGGGTVQILNLRTNSPSTGNVGRYAINYLDTGGNTSLDVQNGLLVGVNGGAAPYINVPSSVQAFHINVGEGIHTDISGGSRTLYGATTLSLCTGLGAGTCSLLNNTRSTPWKGTVQLSPSGSPGSSGVARLGWPLTLTNHHGCVAVLANGSGRWPANSFVTTASVSSTQSNLQWTAGSALTAGTTYDIVFNCNPQ
jgi:hypothetical protein